MTEQEFKAASEEWIACEIKLLETLKGMLDCPHNFSRRHIIIEIDAAITTLALSGPGGWWEYE